MLWPFLSSHLLTSVPLLWIRKPALATSSAPGKSSMLALFSSEEVDVISIEAGDLEDLPLLSPGYEDL